MGIRIYICPIIGTGADNDDWRASGVPQNYSSIIPSNPVDGSPLFPWALVVARATNWSAQDANATLERLFGIDLPDTVDTWAEMKALLQSRTVADIPAARRQALNDRLTARGIDTSQVTLQTTWWQVLRGIVRHLNGGVDSKGDGVRFL